MGYGLIGMKQQLEGSGLTALGKVAQTQEQNRIAEEGIKAAEKAQKTNSIATGAGIGFMVGGPVGGAIGAAAGWLASSIF